MKVRRSREPHASARLKPLSPERGGGEGSSKRITSTIRLNIWPGIRRLSSIGACRPLIRPAGTLSRGEKESAGLALIELLVVLVILGVLVGAVTLAFPDFGARRGEQALARVHALVELACERAALSGRDVGIAVSRDALAFGYFRAGRFEPIPDSPGEVLRPRRIDGGLALSLAVDGRTLALADASPARPQLACLSSGELTPFALELANAEGGRWRLRGHASGRLEAETADAR